MPHFFCPVSIHALLAECDVTSSRQSIARRGFNPRTPCGVRHQIAAHTGFSVKFQSTHSLRSATPRSPLHPRIPGFQSTHSLRSATARTRAQVMSMRGVSIHALLAECDRLADQPVDRPGRFNPRTPCGVRLGTTIGLAHACEFQSTHSLRSATRRPRHGLARATVSIHALLAECDSIQARILVKVRGFNPRTPCGVRRFYRAA